MTNQGDKFLEDAVTFNDLFLSDMWPEVTPLEIQFYQPLNEYHRVIAGMRATVVHFETEEVDGFFRVHFNAVKHNDWNNQFAHVPRDNENDYGTYISDYASINANERIEDYFNILGFHYKGEFVKKS